MIAWKDIVNRVRIIINEVSTSEDTFSEETDTSIEEFIRQALPLLADNPLYRGPVTSFSKASAVTFHQRPDENYYAVIDLPDDFVRLISVQLSSWVRPVYELEPPHTSRYYDQYNAVPGVGAGPASPIAFLVGNASYKAILAHSVPLSTDTFELDYIALPTVKSSGIDLTDFYAFPLAYIAAGLFLQSAGEMEPAKAAFQTAAVYMQHGLSQAAADAS